MEQQHLSSKLIKVGILGQGRLGNYLVEKILAEGESVGLELAFVWSRTGDLALQGRFTDTQLAKIPMLQDLSHLERWPKQPTVIVEVCHPSLIRQQGVRLARIADLMIGSSTALADVNFERKVRKAAFESGHRIYVPTGAVWSASNSSADLGKSTNNLSKHHVLLYYHPRAITLTASNSSSINKTKVCPPPFDRCPLAPQNLGPLGSAVATNSRRSLNGVVGCSRPDCTFHRVEVTLAERTDLVYDETSFVGRKKLASASNFYLPEPSVFGDREQASAVTNFQQFWNSLLSKFYLSSSIIYFAKSNIFNLTSIYNLHRHHFHLYNLLQDTKNTESCLVLTRVIQLKYVKMIGCSIIFISRQHHCCLLSPSPFTCVSFLNLRLTLPLGTRPLGYIYEF